MLSLAQASHQVENQTRLKIACRACAICLTVEGSRLCGHSAALQSERISSLITDKFTPLLVINIVNVYYQMQEKQANDIKSTSKETSLPGLLRLLRIDTAVSTCQCCWFICYFIALSCPSVLPSVCIAYCNWSIFIILFDSIFPAAFKKLKFSWRLFSLAFDHSIITFFMCFQ